MRLIIADSNDLVRAGMRSILSLNKEVEIVGEAKSKEELFDMLHLFETDVVMIDYTSDGFNIDVLSNIKNNFPNVYMLAITPLQSAQVLVDALKQGVTSYVKKDCSIPEIQDAVIETAKGTKFFCGRIVETIQQANLNVEDINYDAFSCDAILISKRESEIIVHISEGLTNAQIAEKLFLSNHTVNSHRKNIMAKLGVKNTAGIVMYAVKSNLVSPNKFLFTASN
ncbi:MAG: response regulator transcription factor [Fluviicola sp.]|nr:response regulator transcription factor [Fluviicola sp.]